MTESGQSSETASLIGLLREQVRNPDSSWSCGTFGAVAEFAWDADEAIQFMDTVGSVAAATARGAIKIDMHNDVRAIAYELSGRASDSWQHGLALCLRGADAETARRTVVSELGPDRDAVCPEDRKAILFDLGLGTIQADICVRSAEPEIVAILRRAVGRPFFADGEFAVPELPRLSPHRVFRCNFGRIEVFQSIPPADGKSPDGPHTHVLPRLLAQRRTHAANIPLPADWIPCMTLFPPNPLLTLAGARKPFDSAQFEAFQSLWDRYGEPELVALKKAILPRLLFGEEPGTRDDVSESRASRNVFRVAARQAKRLKAD